MFQITISPDEIGKLELASFPGEIHVIDTLDEEFGKAIAYLKRQKVIGFDTETRPTFSPDQRSNGTALLQLSGAEKAYLFRIKKMGAIPRRPAPLHLRALRAGVRGGGDRGRADRPRRAPLRPVRAHRRQDVVRALRGGAVPTPPRPGLPARRGLRRDPPPGARQPSAALRRRFAGSQVRRFESSKVPTSRLPPLPSHLPPLTSP